MKLCAITGSFARDMRRAIARANPGHQLGRYVVNVPMSTTPLRRKRNFTDAMTNANEVAKGRKGIPHQGARESARRRGDWKVVSAIDAFKRYPFGINHRFPSITRPDRVDLV